MTETTAPDRARADLLKWRAGFAENAFDADPFFQALVLRLLGSSVSSRLRAVAARCGSELDRLVVESNQDQNLPELRRHDRFGVAREEVVFHPSYHAAGRLFWASQVLSVLAEPGNERLSGAIAYLLDQHGEAGHACPVACTAGAIKLLQRLGSADQRQRYLPGLLSDDYDRRLHAAQFVTEVQGGSDVGSNAVTVAPEPTRPGWYRLSGEKWFCSVADAGLFVVSARTPGGPEGTRGLGLFLVPRVIDGRPNGFQLRRLKDKLGTRSMATGEIEFEGALGEAIGPLGEGFKNLVGIVLDTSRVHNAVAACGLMRRALVEAWRFAQERRAFDHAICDYPAVQETLARITRRAVAGLASTFRILALSDRIETGGQGQQELAAARRIAVMINKYWTALASTQSVRDAIEVLGGNGTVEDFSVLPRLYRDAIVVESWEGTHNTLCAQVLRDFTSRGLHRPWIGQLRSEVESIGEGDADQLGGRARSLLGDVEASIHALLEADQVTAAANIRHVVDRMCRLTDWVSLAVQQRWELANGISGVTGDVLELYRLTVLEGLTPADAPQLVQINRRVSASL